MLCVLSGSYFLVGHVLRSLWFQLFGSRSHTVVGMKLILQPSFLRTVPIVTKGFPSSVLYQTGQDQLRKLNPNHERWSPEYLLICLFYICIFPGTLRVSILKAFRMKDKMSVVFFHCIPSHKTNKTSDYVGFKDLVMDHIPSVSFI